MRLEEGRFDVPPEHLAVVVTHLVCRAPVACPHRPDGIELRIENDLAPDTYRAIFRLVGRDWLWTSRLRLDDETLARVLLDSATAFHTVRSGGEIVGLVELGFGEPSIPKIAFFGLTRDATGRGIGRWLMAHVQKGLFDRGATAILLDTCTLDSPGALKFYQRNGFEAVRREVRVFPDPRMLGLLDPGAAPYVPRL